MQVSNVEVQIHRITVFTNCLFETEARQKKKENESMYFPSTEKTWGHPQRTGLHGSWGHSSVFESLPLGTICLQTFRR